MAESIFQSGLKPSTLTRSDGRLMSNVLWLTTVPDYKGHGLLTGKERLTERQRRYLEKKQGAPLKNEVMADKTAVRIQIDIDHDDPMLHSFVEWSKVNERPGYARTMGLSALYDLNALSDAELKQRFRSAKTKESTWHLYFGGVPPQRITSVSALVDGKFVLYDFERHGRDSLRESGLTAVSEQSLTALRSIIKPLHPFDLPKALCICTAPDDQPNVVIRGGGHEFTVDLRTRELRSGQTSLAVLNTTQTWVSERESELEACWEDAVATYFQFYPEQLPQISGG